MNRLDLIAARARALDLKLRPRTCPYCTLVYRHTAGVRCWGRWFCGPGCRDAWIRDPAGGVANLLRIVLGAS